MAVKIVDNVKETLVGTTTLELQGASDRYFRGLGDAGIVDGDRFPARVAHRTTNEWQTGWYRRDGDTVVLEELRASSSGAAISVWMQGTKDIAVVPLGDDGIVETWASAGLDPWGVDNSAALEAALLAGIFFDGGNRTFAFTSTVLATLSVFSPARRFGLRNCVLDFTAVATSSTLMQISGPALANSRGTTGNVAIGVGTSYTQSAPVGDTSGYTKGTWVLISSADAWQTAPNDDGEVRSEWNVVESVVTNTSVTFRYPLRTAYEATPNLKVIDSSQLPVFENVTILGNPNFNQIGLDLHRLYHLKWDKLDVQDTMKKALSVNQCPQFAGGTLVVNNANMLGFGYGLQIGGSTGTAQSIQCTGVRHAVTVSQDSTIISRNVTIGEVIGNGGIDAIADVHRGATDVSFGTVKGTVASGGTGDGLLFQGANCSVREVTLSGTVKNGVRIQFCGGQDVGRPNHYKIGQCTVVGTGEFTLSITNIADDADRPIDRVDVAGGNFEGTRGVYVSATLGPIGEVVFGPLKSTCTGVSRGPFYFEQNGPYGLRRIDLYSPIAVANPAEGVTHTPFFSSNLGTADSMEVYIHNPRTENGRYGYHLRGTVVAITGHEKLIDYSVQRLRADVGISDGGADYVNGDTVTLTDGTHIEVTAVDGDGAVTEAAVTVSGTRGTNPVTQASTSGSGTGGIFNVPWIGGSPTSSWSSPT